PIYIIVAIGLALAAAAAVYLARIVAKPLEHITQLAKRAKSVAELSELPELEGRLVPAEPREIVTAYNGMVRAIRASEAKVRAQAYTDGLTGVLNRSAFNEAAEKLFVALKGRKHSGLLVFFDLDGFKGINDNHGHATGDKILKELSKRTIELSKAFFKADRMFNFLTDEQSQANLWKLPIFARLGGDEFVLIVPHCGNIRTCKQFTFELTQKLLEPYVLDDLTLKASASLGCAMFPEGADTLENALHRADAALYHSKAMGKGRFCFYAPEEGIRSITEIRREVSDAIKENQMVLFYQPKVDAQTGAVNSVEALVRWQHPQLGLQGPINFIPQIEDSDEICALGEWVLRQAVKDLAKWQASGRKLAVAVNVGARHLVSANFSQDAFTIVNHAGIDPRLIELEITEEIAMRQDDKTSTIIDQIKAHGFSVALDDYGRGYSNLSRLAEVKVDVIKVDRSLILNVEHHERTRKIVAATIAMANALDCRVVAEGIEDASHAAMLRKLGCHELQGYFFAKPMPVEKLNEWLAARETNLVGALQQQISKTV
ncbi:MAG: putative bifunctional diguanylate cyclase/phosphodiesterase, partial [Notoacmeibacter sp.]